MGVAGRIAGRLPLLVTVAVLLGGCGGSSEGGDLKVAAAASLSAALTAYGETRQPLTPRFSFAGSDELATQLERGARPDVYAAANTTLPNRLFAAGLVERPVVFAGNALVLAVPADAAIDGLADLARPGVRLAVGDPGVPVGVYTQGVLDRLPAAEATAIRANVRTEEPSVTGIVGKLTQGAVDAGFLYASDVRAAGSRLRAIALPTRLAPTVRYGAAVVRGTAHPEEARAFVRGLLRGAGARALRDAGFTPPRP